MKTIILSFLLILGLSVRNYCKPINEIFSIEDPVYGEELYVNDIPFNTNEIALASILDGDELKLEEEGYVNDIPFDTKSIAANYMLNMKMKSSDESNINDLPFDTQKLFYEKLAARLTEQYRNEIGINDIPGIFENNFCCYEFSVPRGVSILIKATEKEIAAQ